MAGADRRRIDALDPCVVRTADGRWWDQEAYSYLDGECPGTVKPSPGRQAQPCAGLERARGQHGLSSLKPKR
jgi:alkyl sulfatase BDS1-like metallo-beta-lactamase superfamily hydrolase